MQKLTKEEKDAVLVKAQALRDERGIPARSVKQSRFLVVRKHRKDGLLLLLVATRRPQEREAKVIASWVAGSDVYKTREVDYKLMGGWCVDWGIKKNDAALARGEKPYYYNGGWMCWHAWCSSDPDDTYKADFSKWQGPWWYDGMVGAENVATSRFKYCGWSEGCGIRLVDAVQSWIRNPKTELLARLGPHAFYTLGTKGKMRDMAKNGQLRRFVMTHLGDSRVMSLPWSEIKWLASSCKHTVEEAERRVEFNKSVRGFWEYCRLPKAISGKDAMKYCKSHSVDKSAYLEALRIAVREGLDLRARCNAFPTDFPKYFAERKEFERKEAEAERKRMEEERRQRDGKIKKFIAELKAALAKVNTGDYKILWLEKQADFKDEGDRMHNCIGGGNYSLAMSKRECVCLVLASKGERADVEIGNDWRVVQCHSKHNSTASKAANKIAARIAAALKRHYADKMAA